jgi:hypothetical protein
MDDRKAPVAGDLVIIRSRRELGFSSLTEMPNMARRSSAFRGGEWLANEIFPDDGFHLVDTGGRAFSVGSTIAGVVPMLLSGHEEMPGGALAAEADIMVIGKLADTRVASGWAGHRVLSLSNWTKGKNDAWIVDGIKARSTFYLGSPVTKGSITNPLYGMSAFGRELATLYKSGYKRVGDYLLPPD